MVGHHRRCAEKASVTFAASERKAVNAMTSSVPSYRKETEKSIYKKYTHHNLKEPSGGRDPNVT